MSDLILHLLSVARGFEDDSRYGQARAFRAVAMAEEIRATLPITGLAAGTSPLGPDVGAPVPELGRQARAQYLSDLRQAVAQAKTPTP